MMFDQVDVEICDLWSQDSPWESYAINSSNVVMPYVIDAMDLYATWISSFLSFISVSCRNVVMRPCLLSWATQWSAQVAPNALQVSQRVMRMTRFLKHLVLSHVLSCCTKLRSEMFYSIMLHRFYNHGNDCPHYCYNRIVHEQVRMYSSARKFQALFASDARVGWCAGPLRWSWFQFLADGCCTGRSQRQHLASVEPHCLHCTKKIFVLDPIYFFSSALEILHPTLKNKFHSS